MWRFRFMVYATGDWRCTLRETVDVRSLIEGFNAEKLG